MQQIPRQQLRRWCWYAGRGRNGNVGMWNGEEFLVLTATLRPSIKQEPYFDVDGGCFQPFLRIEEGVVREPFVEQGMETRYAVEMAYGVECADDFTALLADAATLPVIVGGSSALSLFLDQRPWPAEVWLLAGTTGADDVVRQLGSDVHAGAGGAIVRASRGRLEICVRIVPDEVLGALYGMSARSLPWQVTTLSPSGVLCGCLWESSQDESPRQSAESVALDALDCLAEADVVAVEAFLAGRLWPLADALLAEWKEQARRRRWSWSEVVLERRRLQAGRFEDGNFSPSAGSHF
ncbi:MAG: hypothetical protein K0Q68_329 [Moraxellaceae bacterium]|jgi:hypothetical protein|nr:hypothetical protein [Moraxellaceae bacterium]